MLRCLLQLALPIQDVLARRVLDDAQDTLPEESPQKLPRGLGPRKVSM